ncbi:MAG: glycosyltransferase [Holophagaceae bacterium]|nr:glycosyltransferase [Holophagaceae bacterium]
MNILWIASAYPHPGNPYGGIFFQTQLQSLSKLGIQPSVLVPTHRIPRFLVALSDRYARHRKVPAEQLDGKIPIKRIWYFGHRWLHRFGRSDLDIADQILRNLPFQPDLIHGHDAWPVAMAGVHVAEALGIPSVVTLHGSDVNQHAVESRKGARRFQEVVSKASKVLCVSRALQVRTHALTGVMPTCLPIGIDLFRFSIGMDRDEARTRLELPTGAFIVLFVGNLLESKGVAVALEAFRHATMDGVLGVFVGEGPLGPDIEKHPRCIWRHSIPNAEVATYMAAADLMILPSESEGLPTVLVEAGASGLPVLATSVGGIPELLADGRGTLVGPNDVGSLLRGLQDHLANPQQAKDRAERLKAFVFQFYDADTNAGKLASIYQELIEHP